MASGSPLVAGGGKALRVEFYIAPGVSVAHPQGVFQVDAFHTLETLGQKFLKDVKEPGSEPNPTIESLTAQWAVLRQDSNTRVYGRAQMPIKDTGLFDAMSSGDQLVLIPAGHDTATIGFEELAAPPDVEAQNCCVLS